MSAGTPEKPNSQYTLWLICTVRKSSLDKEYLNSLCLGTPFMESSLKLSNNSLVAAFIFQNLLKIDYYSYLS